MTLPTIFVAMARSVEMLVNIKHYAVGKSHMIHQIKFVVMARSETRLGNTKRGAADQSHMTLQPIIAVMDTSVKHFLGGFINL